MKKTKEQKEFEKYFFIKTKVNKDLDKYSGQVLFPEKLAEMNEILKRAKLPYDLNDPKYQRE